MHPTLQMSLESEIRQLKKQQESTHQWYAVRWKRLRDLIHTDAPNIENDACCIMANGTADSQDPPTYAQILNNLRHQITKMKGQNEKSVY